jgi:hypothetical protein
MQCYNSFMRMNHPMRRLAAWIACCAILMAALMPALSQAAHASGAFSSSGTTWMEICSASGARVIEVDASFDVKKPSPAPMSMEPCPYCLIHADTLGLPPAATQMLPMASHAAHFPPLFYQSPRPLFLWAAAQSRAPPSAS